MSEKVWRDPLAKRPAGPKGVVLQDWQERWGKARLKKGDYVSVKWNLGKASISVEFDVEGDFDEKKLKYIMCAFPGEWHIPQGEEWRMVVGLAYGNKRVLWNIEDSNRVDGYEPSLTVFRGR